MENKIQIRLKDNQSFDNAYEFRQDEPFSDRQITEEYWDCIKGICDINNLIDHYKIVTIPPRYKYKNSKIFERINDKLSTYNWVGVISNRLED